MANENGILAVRPVYRINNRAENLAFFVGILGMKVLLEEGAMVELGGNKSARLTRLLLEESPADDGFRAVQGRKRHAVTLLKTDKQEMNQLLMHAKAVQPDVLKDIYDAGFEAISPEGDHFIVYAEGCAFEKRALTEIAEALTEEVPTLSDFEVTTVSLNVRHLPEATAVAHALGCELNGYHALTLGGVEILFNEKKSGDLASKETWDIESFDVLVTDAFDLSALAAAFDGAYLDAGEKVLSADTPLGLGFWFEK
ncbi:MAG: CppA family protein [Streptococcaceae bacterium]|jgi:catechol 2,3-dioxygenase-like lactoylglutathione lyase family enzyme|nr:CppA family protein [Streptococcaceae bacterium]